MPNYRPVICVETGKKFESAKAAAESLGLSQNAVAQAARGFCNTAGGYHWEYAPKENLKAYDRPKPTKKWIGPIKTIEEVQREAARRSRETGRLVRYAHIQIEETLQLYGGWSLKCPRAKKRPKGG